MSQIIHYNQDDIYKYKNISNTELDHFTARSRKTLYMSFIFFISAAEISAISKEKTN
jgi:hypothetical protein